MTASSDMQDLSSALRHARYRSPERPRRRSSVEVSLTRPTIELETSRMMSGSGLSTDLTIAIWPFARVPAAVPGSIVQKYRKFPRESNSRPRRLLVGAD